MSLTVVAERSCIMALKLNTPTPLFDNTEKKIEGWKVHIEMWKEVTELSKDKIAIQLAILLQKKLFNSNKATRAGSCNNGRSKER